MFTENDIKSNRRLPKRKDKINLSALAKKVLTTTLALVIAFTMQLTTTFGTTAVKAKTVDKSGTYQLSDKNCHVGLNV